MKRSRFVPLVAAVVLLLVIGIGAWWLSTPTPEPDASQTAATESSQPEAQPPAADTAPAPAIPEEDTAATADQEAEPGGEQAAAIPEQESPPTPAGRAEQPAAPEAPTSTEDQAAAPSEQAPPPEEQALAPEAPPSTKEQAAAPDEQAPPPEEQESAPEPPVTEEAGAPPEKDTAVAALTPPAQSLDCPSESEAPGCALAAQALRTLGAAAAQAPELSLNQPDGIYFDQDYLVVKAAMPDELGGYLYLDVLTDAGQVFHLLPEPMREDNVLPAGGDIRVGVEEAERAAGVRDWQVAGPFSEGYLLATVSEKRLYEGLRPIEESIADYREVLLQSLADPATGRKAARVERLEFRPRS